MSDDRTAPARQGGFGTALLGGIIGSALTAALILFAAPGLVSSKIVRAGLLADPVILTDAYDALREAQILPVIEANRVAIETPFANSWKGAAKPDVTLVEFFDYACPYCKVSNPAIDRLIEEDKGLRVVYRELPILGPDSVTAARLSLQASKAGRFAQFHDTLWAAGRPAPNTIAAAAQAAGMTSAQLQDAAIENELIQNQKLASELGAKGTPVFVVGDKMLDGAVGYDKLKKAIATARAKTS